MKDHELKALYLLFSPDEVQEILTACKSRAVSPTDFIRMAVRELLDY